MTRIRIIVAALAALALAAPAASADPHAIDAHNRAQQSENVRSADMPAQADEIMRALEQEQAYSTKGNGNVAGLVREQAARPADASSPAGEDVPTGVAT
jgi:hypothetical protein